MLEDLLFSIVIPTYNRASFIKKTVDSVLNQTYQNFEVIVVDDGSTDNTEEIIRQIESTKIKYIKIKNSERGFARNQGTLMASGAYVTFLDSDDFLLPQHFANAKESIAHYNNPPFLHLGYEVVSTDGRLVFRQDSIKNDDISFLIKGNSLSCAGCFLRADVSKKFLFNEDRNLSGSEDWELWFRVLANHGIKIDSRISAIMCDHEDRSVTLSHGKEVKLLLRKELALKYAFQDKMVAQHFHKYYKKIDAFGDSYIALHLALMGNSKRSIHYLLRFIKSSPLSVFSKRFLVIVKYIVLKSVKSN